MGKKDEIWYQAMLWLWSRDEQHRKSERVPLGPPRRLLADVAIDIARCLPEALALYSESDYFRREGGAEIIWPLMHRGEWIGADMLKAMQAA